jgi:hypothetical protein
MEQVQQAYKLLRSQNKYTLGIVMPISSQLQYTHLTRLYKPKKVMP